MNYHIICVGAGGTGGNFLKELGRFLMFYHEENTTWSLSIIDGDTVEARNAERQPFVTADSMQHKAAVMAEALVDCLDLPQDKVTAYTRYIDDYEDLKDIIGYSGSGNSVVLLVGCVDNHRARQVMHEAFYDVRNIIYLDSANEFAEGEVVCGIRVSDTEIAPPRAYFFPEVLKDRGKRASELSCGAINESAPQHLITNLTAAQHLLAFVVNIMENHKTEGGVLHFNAFEHYCRFDRWTAEMQAEKAESECKRKLKVNEKPKLRTGKKVKADGE